MSIARIVLPWPPRELSPNGRPHWREKWKASIAQKRTAHGLALEAGLHLWAVPDAASVQMRIMACPKSGKAYPDDDNLIASLKGARDAIAAVLRVDDSRFRVAEPTKGERCKDGAVVVEIEVVG